MDHDHSRRGWFFERAGGSNAGLQSPVKCQDWATEGRGPNLGRRILSTSLRDSFVMENISIVGGIERRMNLSI